MESHFEKILFMQIYTYIYLIETVQIIFIFLKNIRRDFELLEL